MKIVIELDDDDYQFIKDAEFENCAVTKHLYEAVYKGIPLPKNHGRLIDADELIQDIEDDAKLCYFNSRYERAVHNEMVEFAVDRIADAPTIISAESEEET